MDIGNRVLLMSLLCYFYWRKHDHKTFWDKIFFYLYFKYFLPKNLHFQMQNELFACRHQWLCLKPLQKRRHLHWWDQLLPVCLPRRLGRPSLRCWWVWVGDGMGLTAIRILRCAPVATLVTERQQSPSAALKPWWIQVHWIKRYLKNMSNSSQILCQGHVFFNVNLL